MSEIQHTAAFAPWVRAFTDGDTGRGAILSQCGLYRYKLWRKLGAAEKVATFIMLNPSTADATQDDPTIRRCIGFAKSWACGKLIVVNLFAFRATKAADMKAASDPVGPDNRTAILESGIEAIQSGGPIVCAWGAHGKLQDRDEAVMGLLAPLIVQPQALGENADGSPKHPLYLRGDAKLMPFYGRK